MSDLKKRVRNMALKQGFRKNVKERRDLPTKVSSKIIPAKFTGELTGPQVLTSEILKDWRITVGETTSGLPVYAISVDTVTNSTLSTFGDAYFLVQFTGTLNLGTDTITSSDDGSKSAVLLTSVETLAGTDSKAIAGNSLLWQYAGVRTDYQYAQIKVMSTGDIYVLASFTQDITYFNGTSYVTLSEMQNGVSYQYFLARMTPIFDQCKTNTTWAKVVWITRISAMGLQDLQINIDKTVNSDGTYNDDVYVVGTYSGTIIYDPPASTTPPTTTLPNDMFISRISSAGVVAWTVTSYKNAATPATTSTGYIRGNSVAVGKDGVVAIGSFNEIFSLNNVNTLENFYIPFNMWVAKLNFAGTPVWLISPVSDYNPGGTFATLTEAFVQGDQIVTGEVTTSAAVTTTAYYITGTYQGAFTFATTLENTLLVPNVFIAKLTDAPTSTPTWNWAEDIVTPVPPNILQEPHISYINSEVFINFFGMDTAVFRIDGTADVTLAISGSLDNVFNIISSSGVWGNSPTYIAGSVFNSSVNTAPGPSSDTSNPIYIAGTQTIGTTTTNAYLVRF
jgi:hypothetical protein